MCGIDARSSPVHLVRVTPKEPRPYQTFLAELKRRQVFKVAAVYGSVAFVVMQAADFLVPALRLPETVATVIALVAVLGFPIALAAAWAFDLTSEGLRREAPAVGEELEEIVAAPRSRRWPAGILALVGVGLLLGGGWWVLLRDAGSAAGSAGAGDLESSIASAAVAPKSIAVLPLANLSPDPENEYFAAGLHDDILSQLAKIRDVTVISRTSVLQYAGTDKDIPTIAGELGVEMVLEGSVRRAGGQVRVVAQLIDARTDTHVWSESYDRAMTVANLFEIQTDVAEHIASAMRSELALNEQVRLAEIPTNDNDAYDYYLRGNVYLMRNIANRKNLEGAQAMYERAVALDPQFALAYAGLSRTHAMFVHQGHDRSEERRQRAKRAVDRALELQPDLPEAHLALGSYYYNVFRDYEKALSALEVAERGMPGSYDLVMTQAYIAKRQGRFAEALAKLEKASQLNPRSTQPFYEMAIVSNERRRYADARRHCEAVLNLDPDHRGAARMLAFIPVERDGDTGPLRAWLGQFEDENPWHARWQLAYRSGDYPAALQALERAGVRVDEGQTAYHPISLYAGFTHAAAGHERAARAAFDSALIVIAAALGSDPEDPRLHSARGLALAGLGRADEAVRAGRRAVELMPSTIDVLAASDHLLALVRIHAILGQRDAAIAELDRYLSGPGHMSLRGLMGEPDFATLRDAPGFQALLDKYD